MFAAGDQAVCIIVVFALHIAGQGRQRMASLPRACPPTYYPPPPHPLPAHQYGASNYPPTHLPNFSNSTHPVRERPATVTNFPRTPKCMWIRANKLWDHLPHTTLSGSLSFLGPGYKKDPIRLIYSTPDAPPSDAPPSSRAPGCPSVSRASV